MTETTPEEVPTVGMLKSSTDGFKQGTTRLQLLRQSHLGGVEAADHARNDAKPLQPRCFLTALEQGLRHASRRKHGETSSPTKGEREGRRAGDRKQSSTFPTSLSWSGIAYARSKNETCFLGNVHARRCTYKCLCECACVCVCVCVVCASCGVIYTPRQRQRQMTIHTTRCQPSRLEQHTYSRGRDQTSHKNCTPDARALTT